MRQTVTTVLGKLLPLRSSGWVLRLHWRRRGRSVLNESENLGVASAFGEIQRRAVTARRAWRDTVGASGDEQAHKRKMAEFDRTSQRSAAVLFFASNGTPQSRIASTMEMSPRMLSQCSIAKWSQVEPSISMQATC